jgi:large subunit ribosomal protein L20
MTKGYKGKRRNCYRIAKQSLLKALRHHFVSRKLRKREMRRLWIVRIGAAVRPYGFNYSRFIGALRKAGVGLNRKVLSELALRDPEAFARVVEEAKSA